MRRNLYLGQFLALAVVMTMTLLFATLAGVGIAIQHRTFAPRELDVWIGRSHIVTYTTHAPDCARYLTSCPPEPLAPTQDFYVIWVLTPMGQPAPPDEREMGTRILTLPLRQP